MMTHGMGMFPAKGVAIMLITLAIGYLVCIKAEKEKGFLKHLGYWIGAIIIIGSILSSLCSVHCKFIKKMKMGMDSCSVSMMGQEHPMNPMK